VNLDKNPMEHRAAGLAKGRAAGGAGQAPGPVRQAQFVNLDKDPIDRRAVGLAASQDAGAPTTELSPVRGAQFMNLDKDPMDRRAVGLAAGLPGVFKAPLTRSNDQSYS
jgi:hypothetical protein